MATEMSVEDIEQVELNGTLDKGSNTGSENESNADSDNESESKSDTSSSGGGSIGGKLWSFLNEVNEWFSTNLYEALHSDRKKAVIKLEQLNFLPLYVKKHIANDFYTKMFSQLYPDPPTSGSVSSSNGGILNSISNAAGSSVSKVTNTVANQITATSNYARNLVSTLTFGLIDMSQSVTAGKNCSYQMVQTSIPHLKVTEIRLNDKLTQKGILFSCMKKITDAATTLAKNDNGFNDLVSRISTGLERGLNSVCKELLHKSASEWLQSMKSTESEDVLANRIGGLAYTFIRNGASGQYMNTYELPRFCATPIMLKSMGSKGFPHVGGSGDVLKVLNEMTGNNLTIMENVTWSAQKAEGSLTMGPFEGTFCLFNDTLQMYRDNLDFILRAVTHSMPIRDSFMYRPPCCYDVTDVGNRRCYFCSGEFTVKKIGKIRKLSSYPGLQFGMWDGWADQIKSGIMDGSGGLSATVINDDIVDYIPDAFEISYTFTPLISENYNTFVYYFLNEQYVTDVSPAVDYGRDIDLVGDKLMKAFTTEFTNAIA